MQIGLGIGATFRRKWVPPLTEQIRSLLFSASEPGALYDPSNISTLYQDSAFTVPVTSVEQPVGGMLDLSGRDNHASQATTTKRGVVSRRVNLLTKTEQFADAIWAKNNVVITEAATIAPDGTLSAAKLIGADSITVGSGFMLQGIPKRGTAQTYKQVIFAKRGEHDEITLLTTSTSSNNRVSVGVSLVDGTISVPVAVAGGFSNASASVSDEGDGWFRIEMLFTSDADTVLGCRVYEKFSGVGLGNGISGIYIWRPSVTLAIDAHLPYQSVNTATDYDADPAKFPAYRKLDGVDDSLTCSAGGGGSSGFFFSSVVSPRGSAGTNRTLFSDVGANTGYIVRLNASNQLELAAGDGTAYTSIATTSALAVGASDVVQAWDDGVNLNVKIGAGPTASVARPVVVAGTAGYTMGQDNGASTGYFNGRIYGEIYRKDSGLTQAQREAVALYQRTKARLP